MSKSGFKVIDVETHVMEPLNLWERNLKEPYRSMTQMTPPTGGHLEQGTASFIIGGNQIPDPRSLEGAGSGQAHVRARSLRFLPTVPHLAKVLADPSAPNYLEGQDIAGVDVAVLMPTVAMEIIRHDDITPAHLLALCEVYNDYAAQFCRANPERLKFWGWISPHDISLAVQEVGGR